MKLSLHSLAIIILLLLSACSSTKPVRDVQAPGFLGADAAKLHQGSSGEPELVYRKPGVDWSSYDKIILDPVTFWNAPEQYSPGISRADMQILLNYFHQLIYNTFSKDFRMVQIPAQNTLRVKVAIIKAEQSHVVLDVVSTVVPQLRLLSGVKDLLTGKPAFVGEAEIAFKINDAVSGELLAEGVADRVGGKTLNAAHFNSWGDVDEAFQFWVTHAAYRLCELQKKTHCVKPE